MVSPNRNRIERALHLVHEGLWPYFERKMKQRYGSTRWKDRAYRDIDPSSDLSRDIHALLKAMNINWNDVFADELSKTDRSIVNELMDVRNKWAHSGDFTFDDTDRALDSARRLLDSISAHEQAKQVRALRDELLNEQAAQQLLTAKQKTKSAGISGKPDATLRPWREVITPHRDVASGTFRQAEFAADLSQVHEGEGSIEYLDPVEFFSRTYFTEGLKRLLKDALLRLTSRGGDPVVDLQSNFGGGKTHALLALYHLFSGFDVSRVPELESILAEVGVSEIPQARRVVIVGTAISPGQPSRKDDGTIVKTLWGELAWQLGGAEGYALVAEADRTATNPPRGALQKLFETYSPCLILIDEWVAYARQLVDTSDLPGGTLDAQASFAQNLTESVKAAPATLLVVSLPVSERMSDSSGQSIEGANEVEIGGSAGRAALDRLRSVIGRVQSPWRPANAEESFEIVRRRLFEPLPPENEAARDAVVSAFANLYRRHKNDLPTGVSEREYAERLRKSYPIHPLLFDQLYEVWSTLPLFQRTRGVLRLMAAVIHQLWVNEDRNLLIMPGMIPLADQIVQSELLRHLEDNWAPLLDREIDGENSLAYRLDAENPDFGKVSACRRVARSIFMGSAPLVRTQHKGVDERTVVLACVQPGKESPATFRDALGRLAESSKYLHYDNRRYWYALQATLSSLAEDRAAEFKPEDVHEEIVRRLRKPADRGEFEGVHVCPSDTAEVPDDPEARLVILPPDTLFSPRSAEGDAARTAAREIVERRGSSPRLYRNMLVFLAAERQRYDALERAVRQYLAWQSIDNDSETLNLDVSQQRQVKSRLEKLDQEIEIKLHEAYRYLLVPYQESKESETYELESLPISTTYDQSLAKKASKKLVESERLIINYSGRLLRHELDRIPLWEDDRHVSTFQLWEYFARYLYLPRLKNSQVLLQAIQDGVGTLIPQESFAYAEGYDEKTGKYASVRVSQQASVRLGKDAYVVRPEYAVVEEKEKSEAPKEVVPSEPTEPEVRKKRRFLARAQLDPIRLVREVGEINDNILEKLRSPHTQMEIELIITAKDEDGFDEHSVMVVTENCRVLKITEFGFEE